MKFLWETDDDYPENLIGSYLEDASPDRFDLRKGCALPEGWGIPKIEFKARADDLRVYDQLLNSAMVPLISVGFAEALRKNWDSLVQLIPVELNTRDGLLEGYSIVNVLNRGECVDKERSEYSCIPGTDHPLKFTILKFLKNPDPRTIVREQIYGGFIVVSEEVKELCDEMNLKGVKFIKAADIFV